jgi:sulfite exporter TauE/SafE/copper chaperone CopZ
METQEKQGLQKRSFRIDGMYCVNCQDIIEKELKKNSGVEKAAVNYRTGHASVTYDETIIGFDKIHEIIKELGYQSLEEHEKAAFQSKTIPQIIGTLVIILALFMLLRTFTTGELAASFPLAQEGMGYGMLLIIGLLTGVHCIAMCGGINLSQTLKKEDAVSKSSFNLLLPGILYNGGRLVSYTAVGVLVGALGSVITLPGHFKGTVQLIAGVFMVIMGINMLGLFPFLRRLIPQTPIFSKKIDKQKNVRGPLVVGFLNGFMPCGPLQAMQIYALSTGNPIKGGISMFLFCAGTIPLMFVLSAASSALSGAKRQMLSRRVMRVGAILIAALGLVMFSNGWSLSKFNSSPKETAVAATADLRIPSSAPAVPVIENGVQIVKSTLRPNRYPAITVQAGIPVRWIINAPQGSITGCNYCVVLYEYGIEYVFHPGENVIEFTPVKAGKFPYTCWMGMIRSVITVIAKTEKEG